MKSLSLLFVCLLGLFSFAVASFDLRPSSLPLLVWSKQNYFGGDQQYLDTISQLDVQKLLQSSVGVETSLTSSVDSLLESLRDQHPEVVVLFVESNFGTNQLSQLSSAYSKDIANSAFSNLENSFGSASSSIVFPYTHSEDSKSSLSDTILQVATQLRSQKPAASVTLVKPEGSQLLNNLASSPSITTITPEQFLVYIQNAPIHQNGITDLVVVSFNQNFAEDDAFLGTVDSIVSEKTEGNSLSMFSGLHPIRSRVVRSVLADNDGNNSTYTGGTNCGSKDPLDIHNCTHYTSYFPIAVFQVFLIVLILLSITCVGLICTCSLQTPSRFEVPKKQRTEAAM